ncbi:hypothetical protein GWK47_051437 [Chionoecetes opilio]|uniref:C3H1-type domain-containing protein n=1 Tax=Chionoecetes opilio TaxID=41210 RepID=A0A8J4Y7G1_CHIOP|nr:hypothetical protein GWK47_051437 [Chionoecetes opilio]
MSQVGHQRESEVDLDRILQEPRNTPNSASPASQVEDIPDLTLPPGQAETGLDSQPPKDNTHQQAGHRKVKICSFYLKNMCKHGLQGEKCKYPYPKPCATFMKHGLDENLGCTLGWKCSDYHPLVCRSSLHTRECKRRECKYPHIKGTKRPNNQYYPRSTQQRNQREDRATITTYT